MGQAVLLDNIQHQDLKIILRHGAEFGDNVNQVLVVPTEFAEVQKEYPIFFRQDERGGFQAVALLGLDRDENLFLDESGWQARYVPAIIARGPFLIGFREQAVAGDVREEPMIMVDPDHPRISRTEGAPLFLPHGGNSPHLERIAHTLRTLHQGIEISDAMFAAYMEAGILAPMEVNIRLDDLTEYKLPGLFSISQEALASLDGSRLQALNASGFLALAFYVIASLGNIQRLVERKSRARASL